MVLSYQHIYQKDMEIAQFFLSFFNLVYFYFLLFLISGRLPYMFFVQTVKIRNIMEAAFHGEIAQFFLSFFNLVYFYFLLFLISGRLPYMFFVQTVKIRNIMEAAFHGNLCHTFIGIP